jgi:hypothetical protein
MTNKKKNLIEALYGSFMFIDNLPDLINEETIYNEKGYVDLEFMTSILEWMSRMASISIKVHQALNTLFGCEEVDKNEKKRNDDSEIKWSVEEILKHSTLENNILKLPKINFNRNSYAEAKKWIEEAGGSWRGGKVQGFVFPFNAERVFSILHDGKRCDLQQDFQFFETPPNVAEWLVMISGGISDEDSVLEPSAGRGGLIKSIHRSNPSVIVDCYELMPENKEFLQKMENVRILGDDFTKGEHSTYSKIIANPPFSHNQDIDHVRMMYEFLKEGGTLAAITSKHWEFSNEKKCEDFRAWISSVNGEVFNIPQGEFNCSGTPIETRAIIIRKNVL